MTNSKTFLKEKFFLKSFIVLIAVIGFSVSGVRNADAAVGSCPNANISFKYPASSTSYNIGDTIELDGSDISGNGFLCIYDPSGNPATAGMKGGVSVSTSATVNGSWSGVISVGTSCSTDLATAGDCKISTTVGSAAAAGPAAAATDISVNITNPIATSDFTTLVENILKWLLGISGGIALLMLIFGGITYITSAGDQQKADQGKKIVTWTIWGLVVIFMSYSIIVVIQNIFVK
jgi:hypothetical protein